MTEHPTIGLALGGGAARGLAHIVVLEAFDELGIKPAYIAGASIGALVGAAYASGLTAIDIREHAISVLGNPRRAAFHILTDHKVRSGDLIGFSLSHPVPINGLGLVRLVSPKGVAERIEETVIPFAVNATDFYGASEIFIDSGDLENAVAASIAIPGIIAAPELDGRLVIDGAFSNPVPVNHLRKAGCDILVAVDVTGKPISDQTHGNPGPGDLVLGAIQILQKQITKLQCDLAQPNILITPDISHFKSHDFFRIEEILDASEPLREKLKRQLGSLLEKA